MSAGVERGVHLCQSERLKICEPRDCFTRTQAPSEMRSLNGECCHCPHCQRDLQQTSKRRKSECDRLFCGCYETAATSGTYLPACQCPRPCPCPTCPNYQGKRGGRSVSVDSRVTHGCRCTSETSSRRSYESTVKDSVAPCCSYRKPFKDTGSSREPSPCSSGTQKVNKPRQQWTSDNAERGKADRLELLEHQMLSLQANMNCLFEQLCNKLVDSQREANIAFESSSYVTCQQEKMQRVDYYIRPEDCPPCPPCPGAQPKDTKKKHSKKNQPVSKVLEVSSSSLVLKSKNGKSKTRSPSEDSHVKRKTAKEKEKEEKQRIKREKEARKKAKKEEEKREKEKRKLEEKRAKKEKSHREKESEKSGRSKREKVKEPRKVHIDYGPREMREPRHSGTHCRCSYSARKSMPKLHPSPTPWPRHCEESVQVSQSLVAECGERKAEKAVQTVSLVAVAISATIIRRQEQGVQTRAQTPPPPSNATKTPIPATQAPCGNSRAPPTSQNPRIEATLAVKCPKPAENPPVESPNRSASPKACSRCQMCANGKRMAIVRRDLLVQVKNLIGMQEPRQVALTIVKESPDLYHINVALMRSGQSLGCVYCTEAALAEALKHRFLEQFVTFFVMDSRNNETEKVQFFNFSFECIK